MAFAFRLSPTMAVLFGGGIPMCSSTANNALAAMFGIHAESPRSFGDDP
jgi:hypothetical protein